MGDQATVNLFRKNTLLAALALSAGGCVAAAPKPAPRGTTVTSVTYKADAWIAVASAADRDRIARTAQAWNDGLSEAKTRGFGNATKAEGRLLVPGGAQSRPAPTPGSYSCRMVALGRTTARRAAFERFKPFFCYVDVEGDLFTIVKQTGSQRPAGRLWEDDVPTRLIFLGTLALGNEEEAVAYGDDPKRDMGGVFERIAPFVWRLVIPFPQDGSKLNVFELTPVAVQPKT
jgi:hypothetical protein